MKFGLFCRCGAGAEGEILPDSAAEKVIAAWREIHQGPGHVCCTREEAVKAMMRAEREHFLGEKVMFIDIRRPTGSLVKEKELLAEILFETQRDLESILVRCKEGDPRVDWRASIQGIAEGALARFRVRPHQSGKGEPCR